MPARSTKKSSTQIAASAKSRAPRWNLRRAAGVQILEAAPLRRFPWLLHGFSTRPSGASVLAAQGSGARHSGKVLNLGFTDWDDRRHVEENRSAFVAALIPAKTQRDKMQLVTVRQIHSDIVHAVAAPTNEPLRGDALITATPGLLLAIQTADCIPILLADPRHRAVAAIHAGWRGTLARVAAKTVGRMQMEFATDPCDVLATIGPGISQCCYEVGPDLVKEFAARFTAAKDWFEGPFDTLASGEDPNPLPWLTMMPPGHALDPPRCSLDLKAANRAILAEGGVRRENIFVSDLCTFCCSDLFFSYRRQKNTGRMLSVIGVLPGPR